MTRLRRVVRCFIQSTRLLKPERATAGTCDSTAPQAEKGHKRGLEVPMEDSQLGPVCSKHIFRTGGSSKGQWSSRTPPVRFHVNWWEVICGLDTEQSQAIQ